MISKLLIISLIVLVFYLIVERYKRIRSRHNPMSHGYLQGLNFLLNEQPDKAVDVFIKMLEVDSETVDTHLALGKLFRKQGQVDRSIRIHQNLIARPNLNKSEKMLALTELGQDYLSAGVLDRAQRVFEEILAMEPAHEIALFSLLDIFQQEKEWDKAIDIAKKIPKSLHENIRKNIAHYYCELAQYYLDNHSLELCISFVKKALAADKCCTRANLIKASVFINNAQNKQAIKCLKQILENNPEFLHEVMPLLISSHAEINAEEQLLDYLEQYLQNYPFTPFYLSIAFALLASGRSSLPDLNAYLYKFPSVEGLYLYLSYLRKTPEFINNQSLSSIYSVLKELLPLDSAYQCENCGFVGKRMRWQCPGCKQWNMVKPTYVHPAIPSLCTTAPSDVCV